MSFWGHFKGHFGQYFQTFLQNNPSPSTVKTESTVSPAIAKTRTSEYFVSSKATIATLYLAKTVEPVEKLSKVSNATVTHQNSTEAYVNIK